MQKTSRALQAWLTQRGIPFHLHRFRVYPFFFESIGVWLIISQTLLAMSVWLRWGWPTCLIAFIAVMGGTLDVRFNLPTISWPGAQRGENILIEFDPPSEAKQEVVLSAHYDSKTELLDHYGRMFFVLRLPMGIALAVLLGLLGLVGWLLRTQAPIWSNGVFWLGSVLTLPLLFLAYGLGLNLSLGRLLEPSQGAVDNGAACATLLGLADQLAKGQVVLEHTKVTLALFAGEEANMQGSRAYVQTRDWPLPTLALNLEIMSQDGGYVYWEQDGTAFGLVATSSEVNTKISEAVAQATGQPAQSAGPVNSDGFSFLSAGIPTGILGTYDRKLKFTGFHRPTDNLSRVVMARLPEGVEILTRFLEKCDPTQPLCPA